MRSKAKFEFWIKCRNYIQSSFTVGYSENHCIQLDTVFDIVKSKITPQINLQKNACSDLLEGKLYKKYEADNSRYK